MKLKEAIAVMKAEIQGFYSWPQANLVVLEAMEAAIHNLEQQRWRKLSEEQPTEDSWCEVWDDVWSQHHEKLQKVWWGKQTLRATQRSFPQKSMRWWRPIVGPEEEEC